MKHFRGENDCLKKMNCENSKLGEEENWNAGALLINCKMVQVFWKPKCYFLKK